MGRRSGVHQGGDEDPQTLDVQLGRSLVRGSLRGMARKRTAVHGRGRSPPTIQSKIGVEGKEVALHKSKRTGGTAKHLQLLYSFVINTQIHCTVYTVIETLLSSSCMESCTSTCVVCLFPVCHSEARWAVAIFRHSLDPVFVSSRGRGRPSSNLVSHFPTDYPQSSIQAQPC